MQDPDVGHWSGAVVRPGAPGDVQKNTALEISAVLQICSPERNRTFIVRTGILYSIH